MVRWPDRSVQNDSTFVLLAAEERFPARPILPKADPLNGFLALLLEDLFDEWAVKVRRTAVISLIQSVESCFKCTCTINGLFLIRPILKVNS